MFSVKTDTVSVFRVRAREREKRPRTDRTVAVISRRRFPILRTVAARGVSRFPARGGAGPRPLPAAARRGALQRRMRHDGRGTAETA